MNRLTRLFPIAACLVGAAFIFACSDDLAGPGTPQFAKADAWDTSTFTTCNPQPSASAKAWIGPNGGALRAGGHALFVPAGALKTGTWITMQTPSDRINRVVFGPEGLVFNRKHQPHLVMTYSNCSVPPSANQQIAYVDGSLHVLEMTSSHTDPVSLTVQGRIAHFSEYVLLSTYAVVY